VRIRTPRIGDRVAIPGHAVIFIVKSVDTSTKTVDAKISVQAERIEEGIPWTMLTIIDR
jgi:hypothetical protein